MTLRQTEAASGLKGFLNRYRTTTTTAGPGTGTFRTETWSTLEVDSRQDSSRLVGTLVVQYRLRRDRKETD